MPNDDKLTNLINNSLNDLRNKLTESVGETEADDVIDRIMKDALFDETDEDLKTGYSIVNAHFNNMKTAFQAAGISHRIFTSLLVQEATNLFSCFYLVNGCEADEIEIMINDLTSHIIDKTNKDYKEYLIRKGDLNND